MFSVRAFFVLTLTLMLAGCGLWGGEGKEPDALSFEDDPHARAIADVAVDERRNLTAALVRYDVTIVVDEADAAQRAALDKGMRANSQLLNLRDDPPDSDLGLERRYLDDENTARKLLRSLGYYNGKAACTVDWKASPVAVTLTLVPGQRYTLGTSSVAYVPPDEAGQPLPERAKKILERAPKSLAALGLADGVPAEAAAVSAAAGKVPEWLERRGFPFASATPRYTIFPSSHTLDAAVTVQTGDFARFGDITLSGTDAVHVDYLRRLAPWNREEEGGEGANAVWNRDKLDDYAAILQQTGLFREVRVSPGTLENGRLPVKIQATEAPPRKLTGGVRYSTDNGLGVQGVWEHKNLFGEGEKLRLAMPVLENKQEFSATFTKPAFDRADQNLVLYGAVRHEDTYFYELMAVAAEGGVDRRLSRRWWAGARVKGQSGKVREEGQAWRSYHYVGAPVWLRYDGSNDLLNPTRGWRAQGTVTPYTGFYEKMFAVVKVEGEASAYYAPFRTPDGKPSDTLVLAARAMVGSMPGSTGARVQDIPPALRFYTGGGGSVRGYKYQSIGPKDKKGNPTGGLSYNEVNLEARFKVSETIGLVPFIDGGMVYDAMLPTLGKNMAWAAGLGLRYYTGMGPIRLDIAFPLQNRDNNKSFQFYISIGQAF